jgi:adenylate cyclase class IV
MKNIEFKAELRNIDLARSICFVVGARALGTLLQTDEYIEVPEGRLKRRVERIEDTGETRQGWIWYDRADRTAARASSWTRLDEQQVAVRWPALARKPFRIIVKRRELWKVDNVRVHLDAVAGLGNYFELEGVVGMGDDPAGTRARVGRLIDQFRPALGEPVSGSYADL